MKSCHVPCPPRLPRPRIRAPRRRLTLRPACLEMIEPRHILALFDGIAALTPRCLLQGGTSARVALTVGGDAALPLGLECTLPQIIYSLAGCEEPHIVRGELSRLGAESIDGPLMLEGSGRRHLIQCMTPPDRRLDEPPRRAAVKTLRSECRHLCRERGDHQVVVIPCLDSPEVRGRRLEPLLVALPSFACPAREGAERATCMPARREGRRGVECLQLCFHDLHLRSGVHLIVHWVLVEMRRRDPSLSSWGGLGAEGGAERRVRLAVESSHAPRRGDPVLKLVRRVLAARRRWQRVDRGQAGDAEVMSVTSTESLVDRF
mmetsp:Transcript_77022/g.152837  ORF Transcript_77022/g.152837 Transcript_77022/m.152837 type:complete len:319 (-) Transcript_77022:73-1029(-)